MELNPAHLHLMLNHLPVVGSLAAVLLLAGALAFGSRSLTSAALAGLLLVALVTLPVYLSGEPAEEIVEHSAHVSHDAIEEHEDIAKKAYLLAIVCGIAAIGMLLAGRGKAQYPRWVPLAALLLALGSSALMGLTASKGGKISHPEIRSSGLLPIAPAGSISGGEEERSHGEGEEEEDED